MIKLKNLLPEISSNIGSYAANAGEPDTGWTSPKKTRKLGVDSNKPEPWFEKGGYIQVDFPKADNPYDASTGRGDDKNIQKVKVIKRIKNMGKKYTDFANMKSKWDLYEKGLISSWDKYGAKDYSTEEENE